MKTNAVVFWIVSIYFVVVGFVYTFWNWVENQVVEWTGTVGLFLAAALCGLIGSYLVLVMRKQGGTLTEDLDDSDIDDGDPELGEFSPWSWWPIVLAFGAALGAMGLAIGNGFWLTFFALPIIPIAVVGWIYEYYRGHFAR